MLLRCLQANSSFEEEWSALSGQRLQTGLRQGEQPGRAGTPSVKWSCGNMENSDYSVCVEDYTLSTEIPRCPSMFAKTDLTRLSSDQSIIMVNVRQNVIIFCNIGVLYIFCCPLWLFVSQPVFLILLS